MNAKWHASQIDSIQMLDNGDIAISGGPLNFEVIIYRNRISSSFQPTNQYEIVDSISTKGVSV
jgi:hypothetical protein